MTLDWECLLDDLDGEHCWGSWAWESYSGSKRNLGDFSNRDCMFASKDYFAALSRLHSCVPTILDELEKLDILRKHDFVPDNMNNSDCESMVG